MNVVIVNDHLHPDGGADMVALSSAAALAAAQANVIFFAGDRRPSDDATRSYEVICTGQMDLANDPDRLRAAAQGLWNPVAARQLQVLLKRLDPADTIVHVHSWTKALSSSVFRAAKRAGFRTACTLHDYFSVCPNGTLFNNQTRQLCELRPMSVACVASHCDARSYRDKLYRVGRFAVQQHIGCLPTNVDQFISISHFSENICAQHLPIDSRFAKVRNPIDMGERQPPADPAASKDFVMVARMFAPKGWELFLEACERAGVQAVAVGDGPDRPALERRFPRARYLGQIDRPGVARAMRSSRALVLPSLWHETQGMVIAEAASHGIPAIVSDTCGGAEGIDAGHSGLLFPIGNLDELTAAIRRIANDDVFARRLGGAAAERYWSDPPTPAVHANELLALYRQMLQRTGLARPMVGAGSLR
jgi:glycosyltransferase involved in cell wall biosynthesis